MADLSDVENSLVANVVNALYLSGILNRVVSALCAGFTEAGHPPPP